MNLKTCLLNDVLFQTYVIMLLVLNNRSCGTLFTSDVPIFDWSDNGLSSVKFYRSVRKNTVVERSIEIIRNWFFSPGSLVMSVVKVMGHRTMYLLYIKFCYTWRILRMDNKCPKVCIYNMYFSMTIFASAANSNFH